MDYGIHSDGTRYYCMPMEPEPGEDVRLSIRIAEHVQAAVFLHYQEDDRLPETVPMQRMRRGNGFVFYDTTIRVGAARVRYYYELQIGGKTWYYNRIGRTVSRDEYYDFKIFPGFKTPDWAKGAVLYQIFTDRFYNGDVENDVYNGEYEYLGASVRKMPWGAPVGDPDVQNFYGGDLQGIIDKMDYLRSLGVDGIYLNPIFVSPSNHKYDTQDYDNVDPHYGVIKEDLVHASYAERVLSKENLAASNALFAKLMNMAHKRGLRVIIDGVFNHCGSFNKWMDSYGIYGNDTLTNPENPYRSFFNFDENNDYEKWWSNDTLPKLNYENAPDLVAKIYEVGCKWVSPPYKVDGWRLDVAADLGHSEAYNHSFWKGFRQKVKGVSENCLILAEHYGTPREWLGTGEWDSVMNYDAFMEPVTWFLTGMEKHSDEFREDLYNNTDAFWGAMNHYAAHFPMQSLSCAMNQLSNHDHSRFLTRTNRRIGRVHELGWAAADEDVDRRVFMEAVVFQMTWIGAPTLYYGDEVGLCGFTDPDNRRCFPWGEEDKNLLAFHRAVIKLRKRYHRLFTYGSTIRLHDAPGLLCYGRVTDNEVVIVCINNNDRAISFKLPVWRCGLPKDHVMYEEFQTCRGGFNRMYNVQHRVGNGTWNTRIGEKSTRIFRYKMATPEEIGTERP